MANLRSALGSRHPSYATVTTCLPSLELSVSWIGSFAQDCFRHSRIGRTKLLQFLNTITSTHFLRALMRISTIMIKTFGALQMLISNPRQNETSNNMTI